jgi:hypothetical protein
MHVTPITTGCGGDRRAQGPNGVGPVPGDQAVKAALMAWLSSYMRYPVILPSVAVR